MNYIKYRILIKTYIYEKSLQKIFKSIYAF